MNMTIYDIVYEDEHSELYNILVNPSAIIDPVSDVLTDGKVLNTTHHETRTDSHLKFYILFFKRIK